MPTPSVPVNGAVMHLEKTPCGRGACPVFKLHIYADGRAVYQGERNTPRSGTWERRLTPGEMNSLRGRFDRSGFWQLRARYDGNIMDVGGTYLSYSKNGRTKQVLNRELENPPAAFQQLVPALEALVSSGVWTQPGTTPPSKMDNTPGAPSETRPTPAPATPAPTPLTAPAPTERRSIRRR